MRYRVVAVGRLREQFYKEGCSHYLARLRAFAPCEVVEVREGRGETKSVKRSEGSALLAAADGYVVALHGAGRALTTEEMAARVSALEVRGESRLSLLVGGAEGHDEQLLGAAAESWSLSALTFPHDLARLVTLEQLYRVESLRAGHPYHRG